MTRPIGMDAGPSSRKRPYKTGRLTNLALALALISGAANADLLEYSFTSTNGTSRTVKADHGYVNAVGTMRLALSAGLDRVVKVTLFDQAGTELQTATSKLLTAEDQIEVDGQKTYGTFVEINAPTEGTYRVRAEIQGRWGNSIQIDEYPLVVDTTPPVITGKIKTESPQHYSEINGKNAADKTFSRVYSYRLYVDGVDDNVGVAETRFVNTNIGGPDAGKVATVVKAGYQKNSKQASAGSGGSYALNAFFPRDFQEYEIKFEAEDLAGNVSSITERASTGGCDPNLNPVPLAHYKPGHTGSYLGKTGFIPWKNGDVIYENPPRIIWGIQTNKLYPYNKFGVMNFLTTFAMNGWSYQEVRVPITRAPSGNEGNWTTNTAWACQSHNNFTAVLAAGVKNSPHIVSVESRSTASDYVAGWLKQTTPVPLHSFRVTVDPQNFVQTAYVVGGQSHWRCDIPAGQSQCVGSLSGWVRPSDRSGVYRAAVRVYEKANSTNASKYGYISHVWDFNALNIKEVVKDEAERTVRVRVNDIDTDKTISIFTFTPSRAELLATTNGVTTPVKSQQFSFSNKYDGEFLINYSSLSEGTYSGLVEVYDQHENKTVRDIGQFVVDKTAPLISSNISDGQAVTSLDEIYFTMTDNMDPAPLVISVNLQGGPTDENVNMGSSVDTSGRIRAEYPVLFPSLVDGEEYAMTIRAIDSQGNVGTKSVTFIYNPRQVPLIDGMDGKVWVPAIEYEFVRQNGHHIIQSQPLTLHDGSPVQGSYDVIATLRADSDAPLVINGTTVYPGSSTTVIRQLDFSTSGGRISLPVRAAVGDATGVAKLLVTTSAPNSPILLVDVHLWTGNIVLQSKTWDYRQVVDPLDIIAMPGQDVPCRVTIDEEAAKKADPVRDPVCLIEWTQTPDEAEINTASVGGLAVAGLVGQAVRLGEQDIKWNVYLYSGDGTKVQIGEGQRSINVTTALGSILFDPETKSAYQKIQNLDVRFKQIEGPTCRATLSAEEAINSSARGIRDGVQRVCLFEWQQLPQGLMQHNYGTVPQALGSLDTVGEHTLGWRLSMFSRLGTRVTLAEQTADITVTEPPAPIVSLASNYHFEDDTFMMPIAESYLGDALIKAENAELTVSVEVEGQDAITERYPQNAWASEQSIMRRIPAASSVLWGKRSVVVRAAYTALPEVLAEKVFTIYTVPGSSIKPFIETTADAALDTELLPVTVSIADMYQYREPYNADTMGIWRVRVLRQDSPTELVPLTDWEDATDGFAAFDVDISSTEGRTLRLTAEAQLISPVEGYERTEIAPRNLFLALLLGGEIGGDVITRRISGQAPFTAVFRAVLSEREMFPSVGDIVWETSNDEGATWSEYTPADRQKFTFTQVFDKGIYRVRAKIVNKYSGLTQYTGQVEVTSYDKPTVQIMGPKVLFVGTSTTLKAQAVTEGIQLDENGRRVRVYEEYPMEDVSIDWSLDGGKTYSHQGPTLDIGSEEQQRISVWARIRTNESPTSDSSAYTIEKSSIEFKEVRPPRVRVTGHSVVEKGKPYTFTATSTLPYRDMDLPMDGFFTLPDGTQVNADTVEYTPTEEDVQRGTLEMTYTAWIEGFREEGAEASHFVRSRVWQYVWPQFTMDFRSDASVAPANVTLRVRTLGFNGTLESPTYEWDLPMDAITMNDATNDTVRLITVNEPGRYEFTVTVRDARGHETVVTYPVEIGEAEPFTITLNYSASNTLMREPVDVTIRPEVRGGHPRDRVETRAYFVNGDQVEGSGLYGRATLQAGNHELGMRITSAMGKEVEASVPLSVIPNQPPVCEIKATTSSSAMILNALCDDPDGRIRAYEWTLNGEPISTTSKSMSVSRRTGGDNPVVTVIGIDDSGARSETVEYQGSFVTGG